MKQLVITMLAVAALTGCSLNEDLERDGAVPGQIQVIAGVDGLPTKAYMNKGTGLSGASFIVKNGTAEPTDNFSGGTAYTGTVEATTGKVKFTTVPMYNINDNNAYLVAYFPGKSLAGNAVEWDIDGKTDIMVTNKIWNAGNLSAPKTTGLNFNHQLSRIEVVLKAEAGSTLDAVTKAWGDIQKIEFVDAPSTMKYNLSAKPAVSTSGIANFALLANYDGTAFTAKAIPANTNTVVDAMAMLAPVAPTSTESFTLRVTSAGNGVTPIEVDIPINLDKQLSPMSPGQTHTVTMTFKADDKIIEVSTSTVDDWKIGTSGDNDVDAPEALLPIIEVGKAPFNITSGTLDFVNNGGIGTYTVCLPTTTSNNNKSESDNHFASPSLLFSNDPPYFKFEVATADENGSTPLSRQAAIDACKAKNDNGTGWRMPQNSELLLMYFNRAVLEKTAGFIPFGSLTYWGTAVWYNSSVYVLNFANGSLVLEDYALTFPVRCIREIPQPPSPAVGDYYYTDGTFATNLDAAKTPAGVVYWVDDAVKTHFRVCSVDQFSKPYSMEYVTTGATDNLDGRANMAKIQALPNWETNYPAFEICASKTDGGAGWYLPAWFELQYLYCATLGIAPKTWSDSSSAPAMDQAAFDKWNALFTPIGTDKVFEQYPYLSSTEWDDYSVHLENFDNFQTSPGKDAWVNVRCIKEFGLP